MTYDPQNRKRDPLMGQSSVKPPIQPASDGWYGGRAPEPEADWQRTGYHMEDLPCDDDDAEVLDEENDVMLTGSEQLPMLTDAMMDVDPMGEAARDEEAFRQDAFWQTVPRRDSTATPAQEPLPTRQNKRQVSGPQAPVQAQPGRKTLVVLVVVLAIIAVAALFVTRYVLGIEEVQVVGCSRYTEAQIRQIAGLQPGMGRLQVNEDHVKARINGDYHLQFISLVQEQHKVILTIREREPVAYTSVLGIYYVMDSRGMVLGEYTSPDGLKDLILVDMLNVKAGLPGQYVNFATAETLSLYVQLMIEIRAMSLQPEIRSVNLDDPNELSLYTRDGYFVYLGDASYLHGKLRSMMLVLQSIRDNEKIVPGGTIDVSNRAYPTYDPPGNGS